MNLSSHYQDKAAELGLTETYDQYVAENGQVPCYSQFWANVGQISGTSAATETDQETEENKEQKN